MTIRSLHPDDVGRIAEIHERFYKEEFELPDFFNKFICAFIIENDSYEIISAGGVRTIAESVIVTNKALPIRERREGLFQVLDASAYFAAKLHYDQLHAFIQDGKWLSHLKKTGFNECKGKAVYLPLK